MTSEMLKNYGNDHILEREIYKLLISEIKGIKELHWRTTQPLSLFPGASTCFSQLRSLDINSNFVNSISLYHMAQICKDLNTLSIHHCFQDNPGLISLIDAQRNLKCVKIYGSKGDCKEMSDVLARKGNTINDLHLVSISIIPPSFLTSLINLTKLSIYNGIKYENINKEKIDEFQQYLTISEFPNLQHLTISGLSCFKEISLLIEKTKGNISQVFISTTKKANEFTENTGMLIKTIVNKCPMIESLTTYLEPGDFNHVKMLLLNCRGLESISFNSFKENDGVGDELLDILTKFSPNSLTSITISGDWKYSIEAFKRFFESCRDRVLFRFDIIYHNPWYITKDHRAIVTEYMNEGVIKYSNCRNHTM